MKEFGIFFLVTFFVSAQSGFLDVWGENFAQNMQNFGAQLSYNLQEQGRAIERQAKIYAEQIKEEEMKRQEEFERQQNLVMEIAKQIEKGIIPIGVNSANTTTLTQVISGRTLTINNMIFSTGSENKVNVHTVQTIYDGNKLIDVSMNSLISDGNLLKKRWIQHVPQSGNNQVRNGQSVFINSGSGTVITTNGGALNTVRSSFVNTKNGGMIVQEVPL